MRHILLLWLIAFAAGSSANADQAYRVFDELVDVGWKDAKVHLNYYAIQMGNEPMSKALVIFHPAPSTRNSDIAAWARCIRDYLINQKHIRPDRLVFFVGEPEDKFAVRLWLGVRKSFPDTKVRPLTVGAHPSRRHACASSRRLAHHTQQIVGRERRERVSQLALCGGGCFDSRRRVNSTVGWLPKYAVDGIERRLLTMGRFILWTLMIAATLVVCAFPARAEEITLFNSKGEAIAYIDTDDEMTVYLWKGKPVAYLEKGSFWGFNGDHLGWFDKGVIHDHDGNTIGCIKDAIDMTYQFEPFKSFKQFKPFKSFKKLEPLKPQWKNKWSVTPLSLFLASGEK